MTKKTNLTMTTSVILFLFSLILQSKAAFAAAQNDGPYVSGNIGIGGVSKIKANPLDISHDIAFSTSVAIGNKIDTMRYEGEFGYTHAGNNDFAGSVNALKWMGNLLYDFDDFGENSFSGIIPYLGVGIGWAHVSNKTPRTPLPGQEVTRKSNVFAYQAMAGFGYHLTDNISSRVYYRYFGTTKLNGSNSIYQENTANLGLTYNLTL